MPAPKAAYEWWAIWNKEHPKEKIDPKQMESVRTTCQTDHAFLARCLGYTKFDPVVHDEVWRFFLKKDPSVASFEEFATADTDTHDRFLALPRNGFKSTANIVDVVQTMVVWPNITILIVNGKEELGAEFIGEIKGHFARQDTGEPKIINGEYSLFQLAFPEFCYDGVSRNKTSFTVPCRTAPNIKEDTIQACGVETSQSGPHYDVIIFDDAVTNENSRTPSRLITVRNQISYHRKMMNPYGYCTYIGTWYSPQDHYGFIMRAEEENHTLFWNRGRADSRDIEGRKCLTKIMLRPAMWEKDDKPIDIDAGGLRPEDWELWFPQRLTWQWLMKELSVNRELFHSQLMNNPNLSKNVRFNRNILVRQTRVFSEIPDLRGGNGIVVQSWDTAYSDSTLANYTVGLTALIIGGRYYLVDMIRGQYSDFDMSRVMAESMAKWRPARVVLEDTNGVRWLARDIRRELERVNFYVQIEFSEVENKKNRKSVMAAPVSKLFSEGRIILSNGIPYLDTLYNELEGFQNGAPNDDIVDALSLLVKHFQYVPEASAMALRSEMQEESERRRKLGLYRHVFGLNTGDDGFANYSDNQSAEELPTWVTYSPYDAFRT